MRGACRFAVAMLCACGPSVGTVDATGTGDGTGTGTSTSVGESSNEATTVEAFTSESSTTHPFPDTPAMIGCGDGVAAPGEVCFSLRAGLLSPDYAELGDLDGDGDLDLARVTTTTCRGEPPTGLSIATFAGDGTGELVELYELWIEGDADADLALAHLDGDDVLDAVISGGGDAVLHTLEGDGDGAYLGVNTVEIGSPTGDVAIGDVDGDTRDDVTLATDNGIVLLRLYEGGTFEQETIDPGVVADTLLLADLDGDTMLDLVALSEGALRVRASTGGGTFADARVHTVEADSRHADFGDLDGDGRLDVVVDGAAGWSWLRGMDDGLAPPIAFPIGSVRQVRVGRFDADGVDDVMAALSGDAAWFALGQLDGAPSPLAAQLTDALARPLAIGDLNGDGLDDAILADEPCRLDFGVAWIVSDP